MSAFISQSISICNSFKPCRVGCSPRMQTNAKYQIRQLILNYEPDLKNPAVVSWETKWPPYNVRVYPRCILTQIISIYFANNDTYPIRQYVIKVSVLYKQCKNMRNFITTFYMICERFIVRILWRFFDVFTPQTHFLTHHVAHKYSDGKISHRHIASWKTLSQALPVVKIVYSNCVSPQKALTPYRCIP